MLLQYKNKGEKPMKPIEKKFQKIGNSYGMVFSKFVFEQAEISPLDKAEITFAKNRITIKKKKKEKEN